MERKPSIVGSLVVITIQVFLYVAMVFDLLFQVPKSLRVFEAADALLPLPMVWTGYHSFMWILYWYLLGPLLICFLILNAAVLIQTRGSKGLFVLRLLWSAFVIFVPCVVLALSAWGTSMTYTKMEEDIKAGRIAPNSNIQKDR